MELYNDILIGMLSKHKVKVVFEDLEVRDASNLVEMTCYSAIQRIKEVLGDNSLDDFECIEKIVVLLEGIGTNGGGRHDF